MHSHTHVWPLTKSDMAVCLSGYIKFVWIREDRFIAIRTCIDDHHALAFFHLYTMHFNISGNITGEGPDRRCQPHRFFNCIFNQIIILADQLPLIR